MIACQKVDKSFATPAGQPFPVFEGATAIFTKNKAHAITGASGSGKSTLLAILAGLERIDNGTISIADKEISTLSESQLAIFRRKAVGFVFQNHNLVKELTVIENIFLPAFALSAQEKIKTRGSLLIDRARWILSALKIAETEHKLVGELSGGQMQRASLARALILLPQVIFADEPTGNLDEENATLIFDFLMQYIQHNDATLLIATHSKQLAKRCDKRWVINDLQIKSQIK